MRYRRPGQLWVPAWVLWFGLGSISSGVALGVAGYLADIAGWWTHRPFALNLTSSLAAALCGIPLSVLALSWVLERTRAHRAGAKMHARATTALLAMSRAVAHAIPAGVSGDAAATSTRQFDRSEMAFADAGRFADSARLPDEYRPSVTITRPRSATLDAQEEPSGRGRPWFQFRQDVKTCERELARLQSAAATCAGQGIAFLPVARLLQMEADVEAMSASVGPFDDDAHRRAESASCVYADAVGALEWAWSAGWPVRRIAGGLRTQYRPARPLPAPPSVLIGSALMFAAGAALVWFGMANDTRGLWSEQLFLTNIVTGITGAMVGIPLSVLFLSAVLERTRDHRVHPRILGSAASVLENIADLAARAMGSDVTGASSPRLDTRLAEIHQVEAELDEARYKRVPGEADAEPYPSPRRTDAIAAATSRARDVLAKGARQYAEYIDLRSALDAAGAELNRIVAVADFEGLPQLTDLELDPVDLALFSMSRSVEPEGYLHRAPIAAAELYKRVKKCLDAAVAAGWAQDSLAVPPPVAASPRAWVWPSRWTAWRRRWPAWPRRRPVTPPPVAPKLRAWSWPASWPLGPESHAGTEETLRAEAHVAALPRLDPRWGARGMRSGPLRRPMDPRPSRAVPSVLTPPRYLHALRWTGARVALARRTPVGRVVLHPMTAVLVVSLLLLVLSGPTR